MSGAHICPPQLPAHAAEVQMPQSERTSHPAPEPTLAPNLWGPLRGFGISPLTLAIFFCFVAVAITRWDRWTSQAAIQETDDAYVRTEMTPRETVDALAEALADHAEAEDDRGSLVAGFDASVHSVTIHPHGPREGFEIEVKGKPATLIRPF